MSDLPLSVSVHEGVGGELPDLRPAWAACMSRTPEQQALLSFAWYASWFRHVAVGGRWTGKSRILIAHDRNGEPVGILPLASRRYGVVTIWMLAGPFQPFRAFLCQPPFASEICRVFAETLIAMQRWNEIVRLGPIDVSRPECASLLDEMRARTKRVITLEIQPNICARRVPSSLNEFHAVLRATSSLNRVASRRRKLERLGDFQIVHYSNPTGDALSSVLNDCRTVEKQSWLVRDARGLMRFSTEGSLDFWKQLCSGALGPRGQFDVWVAYLERNPVAFEFSITTASTRYAIAGQYAEAYAKYGLGWMMYVCAMEDAIVRGVRTIDLGFGDVEYKKKMGGQEENVRRDVWVAVPGVIGRVFAELANHVVDPQRVGRAIDHARRRLRRWSARLGSVFSLLGAVTWSVVTRLDCTYGVSGADLVDMLTWA